tara:strand:- start:29 stop:196 length:168 start_codon:yes stop_codon:yes gene_type:complete
MLDITKDRLIAVTRARMSDKNWAKVVARMEETGGDFEKASVAIERMKKEKAEEDG